MGNTIVFPPKCGAGRWAQLLGGLVYSVNDGVSRVSGSGSRQVRLASFLPAGSISSVGFSRKDSLLAHVHA